MHQPPARYCVDSRSEELAELTTNRKRLHTESDTLLAAHFADAIDLETLKRHQDRIRTGLADIDRSLAIEHDHHEGSRKQLATALSLLVDCATLYARTDEQSRRLANQALTGGIDISEDKKRRSDSLGRSPPSHQHQNPPMSAVLVRLKLWT
ncbi:MAG: hypothetical protein QM630_00395 [Microbacterium sp.]